MQKISVAIVGWGNVGRACRRAIGECSDIVLKGVVRRPSSLSFGDPELKTVQVVSDIRNLGPVDVALLCIPSREVPQRIKEYQALKINTVDSYDEHQNISALRRELDMTAKVKKTVSIFAAGWDPGTDSLVRALMKVVSLTGRTTTTFGGEKGGRSMGHTVQAKSVPGVKNAVSLTFANGRGQQKRKVYVELQPNADICEIEKAILSDAYFKSEPTEVIAVDSIEDYNTLHHSAKIERTGMEVRQTYAIEGINPEFTANIMVASVRACMQACKKEDYGVYTFIERPIVDFLPGSSIDERLEGY